MGGDGGGVLQDIPGGRVHGWTAHGRVLTVAGPPAVCQAWQGCHLVRVSSEFALQPAIALYARSRAQLRSRPLLHAARMASRAASCAIGLAMLLAGTPPRADNFRGALPREQRQPWRFSRKMICTESRWQHDQVRTAAGAISAAGSPPFIQGKGVPQRANLFKHDQASG